MKILIIEDDANIVAFMRSAFQIGWPEARLEKTGNGVEGLRAIEKVAPDIILLDLGLPDMDGFDVLKKIRSFSSTPVIIVTVSGDENYVVRGLSLGADDYVIKPLRPLELIARMKSLLRKRLKSEDLSVTSGNLRFGDSLRELIKGESKITLTDTEGRLMYILMKNTGYVVAYSQIAEELWGTSDSGYQNNLKVHIRHIRQKVEDEPDCPKLILNRLAAGYILMKPR